MNFEDTLRQHGLKATPQRVAVLNELGKKTHPTMDEIYAGIKSLHPTVSLATVYKNLNVLKEKGVVIEINMPNGKMRYDYLAKPHMHIACSSCGSIEDMDYDKNLLAYQETIEKNKHIHVERIELVATTSRCSFCG